MTWPFPGLEHQKYGALLIDPPWAFKTYSGPKLPTNSSKSHYEMMSYGELCALPVPDLCATDCAIFMWAVDTHLDHAMTLGEAVWGFTYKTIAFVWDKGERIGMGFWTRKQAEVCLLFTRGKPKPLSHSVRQIIRAPRREHSRKPDEQYERIQQLVAGPYCELFARQKVPGWDTWGDETDKFEVAA